MPKINAFYTQILQHCDPSLLSMVRTHAVRTYSTGQLEMFVLREDESGFGLSGCKKRKYASLIPWIEQQGYKEVALIGGANSNHIAAILQLLIEREMGVRLFLKKPHQHHMRGNRWLIDLMTDPAQIHWLENRHWDEVEAWVRRQVGPETYVIPEGGSCMPALPGACTLFQQIENSERQSQRSYDHIFMDAGTGMMAGVMAHMIAKTRYPAQLHVVLVAGNEESWHRQLTLVSNWWEEIFHQRAPELPAVKLHYPVTARSFGSVNATVWRETQRLAREEGILTDPVYTTKLFITAGELVKKQKMQGDGLIVHSGGGIGLIGFAPG